MRRYFRDLLGEGVIEGRDAVLHAHSLLAAHVGLRVLALADEDDSQSGSLSRFLEHLLGFGQTLGMDRLGHLLSVDNLISHISF